MATIRECKRCGHRWKIRKATIKFCPNCKTPYWNEERPEKLECKWCRHIWQPMKSFVISCPKCHSIHWNGPRQYKSDEVRRIRDDGTLTYADRFWEKVKIGDADECWEWQGAITKRGYGNFRYKNSPVYTHRVAWQLTNGFIPDGKYILHNCDNPKCVNPKHLRVGTQQDNVTDMVKRNRNAKGQKNGMAKLTDEIVLKIIQLWNNSKLTAPQIAKVMGTTKGTIHGIAHREIWRHITNNLEIKNRLHFRGFKHDNI